MGVLTTLGQLDQKVVPRLARGLSRITRATGGWRLRPLTVVAVLLSLAVAATAVWRLVRPEPGTSEGHSTVWVGVRDGDSVPQYVESSNAELAALTAQAPADPILALVSLTRYLTPQQVRSVVTSGPDLTTVKAYARVPLLGRQTERVTLAADRVPDDLLADMVTSSTRMAGDAATYEQMAIGEPTDRLRTIYTSNAVVLRAQSEAYRAGCACVFALLVRAAPTALTALARQADVRTVDPTPEVTDDDDAVFAAPLPEQVDRVQPPADDLLTTN